MYSDKENVTYGGKGLDINYNSHFNVSLSHMETVQEHTNTHCLLVAFLPSLCTHFFRSMKLCAVRELGFSTLMKLISSTEKSSSLASSVTATDTTTNIFLEKVKTLRRSLLLLSGSASVLTLQGVRVSFLLQ